MDTVQNIDTNFFQLFEDMIMPVENQEEEFTWAEELDKWRADFQTPGAGAALNITAYMAILQCICGFERMGCLSTSNKNRPDIYVDTEASIPAGAHKQHIAILMANPSAVQAAALCMDEAWRAYITVMGTNRVLISAAAVLNKMTDQLSNQIKKAMQTNQVRAHDTASAAGSPVC